MLLSLVLVFLNGTMPSTLKIRFASISVFLSTKQKRVKYCIGSVSQSWRRQAMMSAMIAPVANVEFVERQQQDSIL